jgi:hypothetical protein
MTWPFKASSYLEKALDAIHQCTLVAIAMMANAPMGA